MTNETNNTATNCDIQIGDSVHIAFLNKTGYVFAVWSVLCKSYSVKFSDGQQWNIVEKDVELVRA